MSFLSSFRESETSTCEVRKVIYLEQHQAHKFATRSCLPSTWQFHLELADQNCSRYFKKNNPGKIFPGKTPLIESFSSKLADNEFSKILQIYQLYFCIYFCNSGCKYRKLTIKLKLELQFRTLETENLLALWNRRIKIRL